MTDEELLERAVHAARDKFKRGKHYRWVAVMHVFAIGKTNAHQLCQRFGLDPDELVS